MALIVTQTLYAFMLDTKQMNPPHAVLHLCVDVMHSAGNVLDCRAHSDAT